MSKKVLKDSKTHENLKAAFAGESQANRRYEYFSLKADQEGFSGVAELFRSTARGETAHAFRHLDFLSQVGDPVTDLPIRSTEENLASASAGERYEYQDMYPGMAKTAREEGFEEIGNWFDVLAKAERIHAAGFEKALSKLRTEQHSLDLSAQE
ncbi:rubrerythrin family protein [Holospora curviuscula]|uniref:Rubrerythrin n=1 Tax=Holospora curviuscula TaxID=1082868 RepID=A0A2S5R829_9PROT|nr:rubrerythrin family protein [Holospora curviuscula]PPE03491.1 Rubrerythrin [Holospora curviuscula]